MDRHGTGSVAGRGEASKKHAPGTLKDAVSDASALRMDLHGFLEKLEGAASVKELSAILSRALDDLAGAGRSAVYTAAGGAGRLVLRHSAGIEDDTGIGSLDPDFRFCRWLSGTRGTVLIESFFHKADGTPDEEMGFLSRLDHCMLGRAVCVKSRGDLSGLVLFGKTGSGGAAASAEGDMAGLLIRMWSPYIDAALKAERGKQEEADLERFLIARNGLAERYREDILSPLSVLKSTLCSMDPGGAGESVLLDMARDAAGRMTPRLDQLLSLCGVEAGDMKLEQEKADLSTIIEDCLREMIPEIEEKGLRVSVEDEAAGRELYMDIPKMTIALRSALEHAVSIQRRDGGITVETFVNASRPDSEAGAAPASGPEKGHGQILDDGSAWLVVRVSLDRYAAANGGHETDPLIRELEKACGSLGDESYASGPEPSWDDPEGTEAKAAHREEADCAGYEDLDGDGACTRAIEGDGENPGWTDPGLLIAAMIVRAHGGAFFAPCGDERPESISIWLPAVCY